MSLDKFSPFVFYFIYYRDYHMAETKIGNASAFASSLLCKQWLQSRLKEYAFFIITKLLSYVYNQTYNKGSLYEKEDISRQVHHGGWHLRSATLVSGRLVKAENLDWPLFRVSEQRLIKWFRTFCHIFNLGLHSNWTMPTSLPTSVV